MLSERTDVKLSKNSDRAAKARLDAWRILVVEDNVGDLRLLQAEMKDLDAPFMLEWAPSLADALPRNKRGRVDAVLLDLGLPDSRGLETLEKFRTAAPQTPVVVLTGSMDEEEAAEAVAMGAQDYFVKGSTSLSTILKQVRAAIARASRVSDPSLRRDGLEMLLAQHSHDGFMIVAVDGSIIYGNEAAARMLDVPPASLAGRKWSTFLFDGDDRTLPMAHGQEARVQCSSIDWDGDKAFLAVLQPIV